MNQESIILMLCSLGIAQGIFLCFYLLTLKKGNRLATLLLVSIIFGLLLRIGKSILNVYLNLDPWQRNLGIAGVLLVGPSLWFYGKVLVERKTSLKSLDLLHFYPYVAHTLFCWLIPNSGNTISYIAYYAVFGHLLVYLLLSVNTLFKNKNATQPRLFKWYRNLTIGVMLLWAFYIGNILGVLPNYIGGAIFFTLLVYIFSFLLLQNHTFSLEKYQGQTIDTKTSAELSSSIAELFKSEEIYLQPNLSLQQVAKKLTITPRTLSRVINENNDMNFSEYVNFYRIEKAKTLLQDPNYKNEKMITVAFDSGFGNVTSFNIAFKAFTKQTPSQFKRDNRVLG